MPRRQTLTSNIDSEMLAELFQIRLRQAKYLVGVKVESFQGNSFMVRSSGKEKGSSSTLGSARKLSRLRQRMAFLHRRLIIRRAAKKRKVGDRQQNIDSEIANLASSTSDYYTRLGSFEESLGRSYGSADMDSFFRYQCLMPMCLRTRRLRKLSIKYGLSCFNVLFCVGICRVCSFVFICF